ncbi:MAG: helix-turn-helix transcriptional regulator [Lachnospiraceae bacterium]|nr:helix-turn-helix transcriptional regulator [Lachnospiraceae bacterium]
MKKSEFKQIAKNIKLYRNLRNLTQEQVAAKLDIDTNYYSQLEQGRRRFTLEKVVGICRILNVNPDKIIPSDSTIVMEDSAERKKTIEDVNSLVSEMSTNQLVFIKHVIEEMKLL